MANVKNSFKESYPQNLLNELIKDEDQIFPADIDQTLAYILTGLPKMQRNIIEMYFICNMPYVEIASTYGITKERVHYIKEHALRILRHPRRLDLIKTGVRNQIKKAYDEGYHDATIAELKAITKNITAIKKTLNMDTDNIIDDENIAAKNTTIDEIFEKLSVRSYNVLKRSGIETLGDICKLSRTEFANLRNLGRKSYEEIVKILEEYDLEFRDDDQRKD